VRVIAGKYKGRVLTTVRNNSVRPATDHVKGSIFNILQNRLDLRGARVLDLYAGSGSLGFEAISRGAAHVTFVEQDGRVADVIEENARSLGCLDACIIVPMDAGRFVASTTEQFGLIFADPPYDDAETPMIPQRVFERQLLATDGFCIIEHDKRTTFEPMALYRIAVAKVYGNTRVTFFTHPPDSART
jgi:16S rRNA (guanine966-N2)-methyltransferase